MKNYAAVLIEKIYGTREVQVHDCGGGFYGKVFLAVMKEKPYQVIIKFYLQEQLYEKEKLQLDELRKYATLTVPEIYAVHSKDAEVPYDALLMEYIQGENAGNVDVSKIEKETVANQIVDNLIAIHSHSQAEGFGELGSTTYYQDWREYYKIKAAGIVEKADKLYEQNWISQDCIQTVHKAYEQFASIFTIPITKAGLIHGDYNTWNLMLDNEGKNAVAMIDPYQACYADPEYDLYQLNNANGKEYGLFELYKSKCELSPNWKEKLAFYELFSELMHYYDAQVQPQAGNLEPKVERLQNYIRQQKKQ